MYRFVLIKFFLKWRVIVVISWWNVNNNFSVRSMYSCTETVDNLFLLLHIMNILHSNKGAKLDSAPISAKISACVLCTCFFTCPSPSLDHTWSWKFFSEGEPSKIFLGGMWGGIQMFKVLSVREIFFCFISKFLKIKSGIYKFRLQGDMGRDAR